MENNITKKSHKNWRKEVKKLRRKKIRQKLAQELEKQHQLNVKQHKDPTYLTSLAEQRTLQLFREEQEKIEQLETDRKWKKYEETILKKWEEKKKRLAEIEEIKRKEILRIQQEFEAEQKRIQSMKDEKIRVAEEKQRQYELLMEKLDDYIYGNGELPQEFTTTCDTNPAKPNCPFFDKTSSCRFGDKCLKNHCRPGASSLLIIPNFFTHIRLEQSKPTEYGSDLQLEFDDDDLYKDFLEFFDDVVPELQRFGPLTHFRVCNNNEPHLRGHVYVEFKSQRDAVKAYRNMQGRYYAGRMINLEFGSIYSWKAAVCGLSFTNKCPKGRSCNFLHVFKNPKNKFPLNWNSPGNSHRNGSTRSSIENRRSRESAKNHSWDDNENDNSRKRNWRWSETPDRVLKEHKKKKSRSRSRSSRSQSSSKSTSRSSSHRSKRSSRHSSKIISAKRKSRSRSKSSSKNKRHKNGDKIQNREKRKKN